jgi:ubiquinone/menaquinone biosynthesis C-methylase UbiE
MTGDLARVRGHYAVPELGERILAALENAGKDLDALAVDDLAPVDAFHIRGRGATEELAEWAGLDGSDVVLDVGSGVGGTARYLADRVGCDVVGIDLTEEYCEAAEMLSARVGLEARTSFHVASALDLPFDDGEFDAAWTEHVQMNIADKERFYGEIARVVRDGGRFAFHDILAGPESGLHVPVPWAGEASISHLVRPDELRSLLERLGFTTVRWEDTTEASIGFFDEALGRIERDGPPALGLHQLMGESTAEKFGNVRRNLADGHVCVAQAVMTKSGCTSEASSTGGR